MTFRIHEFKNLKKAKIKLSFRCDRTTFCYRRIVIVVWEQHKMYEHPPMQWAYNPVKHLHWERKANNPCPGVQKQHTL